jgi:hypothetical protein
MSLAIDLFCGLGGWTDGLMAEGYDVIGFDIEQHVYGEHRYPAQLVVQDVLTLHGSQFKTADLIVASPPCQEYSYMAMPWKLAKAKAAAIRADTSGQALADLNRLFNACFRIQREASLSAGRHIPLVVENVRGAQPWVGRARWNFGSFYLWGDVPALMPLAKHVKVPTMGAGWYPPDHPKHVPGLGFNTHAERHTKNTGGSWFNVGSPGQKVTNKNPVHELSGVKVPSEQGRRTDPGKGVRFTSRDCGVERDGLKNGNDWFGAGEDCSAQRRHGSKSVGRKAASAMIAKIPLPLSRHIARAYLQQQVAA